MKLNWGFGIAAVYVLFAGSMIWFAVKASQQKNDLVTENYYEEAVKYQDKIDAGINAESTTSKLFMLYLSNENAIQISGDIKLKNCKGTLSFYKPDNSSDDFQLGFSLNDSAKTVVQLKPIAHGYWKVNASWIAENKNCIAETRLFIK